MSEGGTVLIIGDQELSKSIPLIKTLNITTTHRDRGRIFGHHGVEFSFEVKKAGVNLYVSKVEFLNISVVTSGVTLGVHLNKIYVTGGFKSVIHFKKQLKQDHKTDKTHNRNHRMKRNANNRNNKKQSRKRGYQKISLSITFNFLRLANVGTSIHKASLRVL